jgi:hypothetical protein
MYFNDDSELIHIDRRLFILPHHKRKEGKKKLTITNKRDPPFPPNSESSIKPQAMYRCRYPQNSKKFMLRFKKHIS